MHKPLSFLTFCVVFFLLFSVVCSFEFSQFTKTNSQTTANHSIHCKTRIKCKTRVPLWIEKATYSSCELMLEIYCTNVVIILLLRDSIFFCFLLFIIAIFILFYFYYNLVCFARALSALSPDTNETSIYTTHQKNTLSA